MNRNSPAFGRMGETTIHLGFEQVNRACGPFKPSVRLTGQSYRWTYPGAVRRAKGRAGPRRQSSLPEIYHVDTVCNCA